MIDMCACLSARGSCCERENLEQAQSLATGGTSVSRGNANREPYAAQRSLLGFGSLLFSLPERSLGVNAYLLHITASFSLHFSLYSLYSIVFLLLCDSAPGRGTPECTSLPYLSLLATAVDRRKRAVSTKEILLDIPSSSYAALGIDSARNIGFISFEPVHILMIEAFARCTSAETVAGRRSLSQGGSQVSGTAFLLCAGAPAGATSSSSS